MQARWDGVPPSTEAQAQRDRHKPHVYMLLTALVTNPSSLFPLPAR
jgi:hypothetical protein